MPTATDLVTDLPADFEVFGQAVDTALMDLKGGTTGQVLKKNSNTDMDFVWGTDSAGMTNPMTTTGDTIYSSSGSTPARLGIGTTGQVLTVSGGLPSWGTVSNNAVTQIATGSLPAATQLQLTGLSSYSELFLQIYGMTNATAAEQLRFRINNVSSGTYAQVVNGGYAPETYSTGIFGNNDYDTTKTFFTVMGGYSPAYNSSDNAYFFEFTNCKEAGFTNVDWVGTADIFNGTSNRKGNTFGKGVAQNAAAVSSIEIFRATRNFTAGTYILWGR